MKQSRGKKALALLLIGAMAFTMCTGYTYVNGFGTVYYEPETEIFNGTVYAEAVGQNASNGQEHAYYVHADLGQGLAPYVYSGVVTDRYTLKNMVKYVEGTGYKVVAAINGDIFDTNSGAPKNPVIHDYNIMTSGYAADRVITFDAENRASMAPASLAYSFSGTIRYDKETSIPSETTKTVTQEAIDADGNPYIEELQVTESAVTVETESVTESYSDTITYFNIPYGNSDVIRLYNAHYGSRTGSSGNAVEVLIKASDVQLQVGKTITGTVVSVGGSKTAIGEGQLVLSVPASSEKAQKVSQLLPGSEITITVSDTGEGTGLQNAKEAVGLYYSIVENGKNVTNGTNLNPRTVLGIKDDGSVLLYVLDGRQASAKGLGLYDLANAMIDMGCTYAFNLDGGGSSTLYARKPGMDSTATLKNKPSSGSERSVTNALMLVYKDAASSGSAARLSVYPSLAYAMPGASVKLAAYPSDEQYEKLAAVSGITYSAESGSIDAGGIFTAGSSTGTVKVNAKYGGITGSAKVIVTDDVTLIPSVTSIHMDHGQSVDINMKASTGPVSVSTSDTLFTFSCDENIGTVDANGLFTSTKAGGSESGNVYVTYADKTVTIPVTLNALTIAFSDTKGHWAEDYIGSLATRGILEGIGNDMFNPDGKVTRAQFLAILAKSLNADVASAQPAAFTDNNSSAWYYNYVNWGYENGLVNGTSETTFAPNEGITREQMTVMLCKYSVYLGYAIPQTGTAPEFKDSAKISDWARDYVVTIVGGGMMNGMGDGTFEPQGTTTRAQAAKVIYVFLNTKDGIK